MNVYLAGPIAGTSYAECTTWRDKVKSDLQACGITAFSPMRAKQYLSDVDSFVKNCDGHDFRLLSSNRGIMTRDRWDATRCDLLFVNVLGAKEVSIGTVMEIAFADLYRIPIVCAIEPSGDNPHDHGMICEAIGFRVPTIDEAVEITKAVLLP